MLYSDLTFGDKNPIKRWLQRRRLTSAVKLAGSQGLVPKFICDFGSGNGELCKLLSGRFTNLEITCYEPTPQLMGECRNNLHALSDIEFVQETDAISSDKFDIVFCLEVFEHLPFKETDIALQTIYRILKPEGIVIVGVPVEIGFPALYKGLFRMSRRYGTFDATPNNIIMSLLGFPPKNRPMLDIAPGIQFHFDHVGFDFRELETLLCKYFKIRTISASPIGALDYRISPEVYFVADKSSELDVFDVA